MDVKMNICSKCGGKGKLSDFDHTYTPASRSKKFLMGEHEFTTFAVCMDCGRITEDYHIPLDAINSWNRGEIYNGKEWGIKWAKEYTGRVYTNEEIKNFILQTKWTEGYDAVLWFTNGDRVDICFEESKYCVFSWDIWEKDINKTIHSVLNTLNGLSLKVKEMEYEN